MSSIAASRLSLVSDRGAALVSGAAIVAGATSRGDHDLVNLTVRRNGNRASLTGGMTKFDNGRVELEMTRNGKISEIRGSIGFNTGFLGKQVALTVVQESFTTSTVKGVFMGKSINLSIQRDPAQPGVTRVTGKLFPYEQPAIGTVAITIRDVDGLRSYEGGTSTKPEGRVSLQEARVGDVILTTGKLSGWNVTELEQPASFRSLELFDTTLLVIMSHAMRQFGRG